MEKIGNLTLLRANNESLASLRYTGGGVWKAADYTVPRDGDDRYRFMAEVDGHKEVWGSDNTGRDAQDPGTVDPANTYFNIRVHTDQAGIDDSYRSIFKFHGPIKGMETDVTVSMNGGRAYHSFDFGFELVAPQITALLSLVQTYSLRQRTA